MTPGVEYLQLLRSLADAQLEQRPDPYLRVHLASEPALQREVDAFGLYSDLISGGRILDWGCRHAPSSCLVRKRFGEEVELFGCDVVEPHFAAFHDYAGLMYSRLEHRVELPYGDKNFALVIANGVLEHVSDPVGSLGELRRVLEPGGYLAVTFLPNRWSYTEAIARRLGRPHHDRLFRPGDIAEELSLAGFEIIEQGFHQVLPTLGTLGWEDRSFPRLQAAAGRAFKFDRRLEGTVLRNIAANIYVIARRPGAALGTGD